MGQSTTANADRAMKIILPITCGFVVGTCLVIDHHLPIIVRLLERIAN